MKKNVKGFIGLFLALASILLIIIAYMVPMEKLTGFGIDGKITFYGNANCAFVWISVACAVAAIVFGIMAVRHKDQKGPRKVGIILGIICVIVGLLSALVIGLLALVTEYINTDGKTGVIAEVLENDSSQKENVDKIIRVLQKSAGVPETGIGISSGENTDDSENDGKDSKNNSENKYNKGVICGLQFYGSKSTVL